jgi:putative transposase
LSDPERATLAEIGKRLGRKALHEVARIAKPDTILAWYRRLIARKFDGSKYRQYPGRPKIKPELEALVVQMARENSGWGYDRIVGALANLGHRVSDRTVGNILRRHGMPPAPKRSQTTSWKDFIAAHMSVLAGADFFTVEVLTWRGLVTYYETQTYPDDLQVVENVFIRSATKLLFQAARVSAISSKIFR